MAQTTFWVGHETRFVPCQPDMAQTEFHGSFDMFVVIGPSWARLAAPELPWQLFSCYKTCFTSLSSGNQVDG